MFWYIWLACLSVFLAYAGLKGIVQIKPSDTRREKLTALLISLAFAIGSGYCAWLTSH